MQAPTPTPIRTRMPSKAEVAELLREIELYLYFWDVVHERS